MSSDTTVDIYTTPAGPPPPGQVSNLVNPFYLRTISFTTHALCLAISTIAVALRIFTKVHVMKQFRYEDCNPRLSHLSPPSNAKRIQMRCAWHK